MKTGVGLALISAVILFATSAAPAWGQQLGTPTSANSTSDTGEVGTYEPPGKDDDGFERGELNGYDPDYVRETPESPSAGYGCRPRFDCLPAETVDGRPVVVTPEGPQPLPGQPPIPGTPGDPNAARPVDTDGPGGDAPGETPPAPAPPPRCIPVAPQPPQPSWALAPLPASPGTIHANPRAAFKGVTGMESWFWWRGPTSVSWAQVGSPGVTATCELVPPPTQTFSASVREYRWTLGDGATVTTGAIGGVADPAARHTYETKSDDYVVEVERLWVGDPAGQFVDVGGDLAYPVQEIRSVLTEVH